MTGRLNPQPPDFDELRYAARERRRADADAPADTHQDGFGGCGDEKSVPVERITDVTHAESASASDTPATDDVAAYLRARHSPERRDDEREQDGNDRSWAKQRDRADMTEEFGPGAAPNGIAFLAECSGGVSKPYLDRIPDAYAAQLEVFEWLEGLLERAGHDGTMSALEYYESIGWLSERSREELIEVASGLSATDPAEQPLCIDDHRESLVYVARLAQRRKK